MNGGDRQIDKKLTPVRRPVACEAVGICVAAGVPVGRTQHGALKTRPARTQAATGRAGRSGYLLLEVVIALGLLTMGLATIGLQIQKADDTSRDTQRILRAMHLAQSKLAEFRIESIKDLDGQDIDVDEAIEDDLEEEFGRLFPDFAWRLRLDPTQTPGLWLVRMSILHQERRDVEEEFDFEEAEVVYVLRTFQSGPYDDGDNGGAGGSGSGGGGGGDPRTDCPLNVLRNAGYSGLGDLYQEVYKALVNGEDPAFLYDLRDDLYDCGEDSQFIDAVDQFIEMIQTYF